MRSQDVPYVDSPNCKLAVTVWILTVLAIARDVEPVTCPAFAVSEAKLEDDQ